MRLRFHLGHAVSTHEMNDSAEWFELQLGVARWHLDAALAASNGKARIHIQQARDTHARICGSILHTLSDEALRARLERECAEIKTRLDAVSGT